MPDRYWQEVAKQIEDRRNAAARAVAAKYRREHGTSRRICKECGEGFMGWGTIRTCEGCRLAPKDEEFQG